MSHDHENKVALTKLSFYTVTMVKRFILSSIGKIHQLQKKCCVNWRSHGWPIKYICNFVFKLYLSNFDIMCLNTLFYVTLSYYFLFAVL